MLGIVRYWSKARGVGRAVMHWPNSGTEIRLTRAHFAIGHIRAGVVRAGLRRGETILFTAVSPATREALGILRVVPPAAADEASLPPLDPIPPAPPTWTGSGRMLAHNHELPGPTTAPRTCIRCGGWFTSSWAGHRFCDRCKAVVETGQIFTPEEAARLWAFAAGGRNGNGAT